MQSRESILNIPKMDPDQMEEWEKERRKYFKEVEEAAKNFRVEKLRLNNKDVSFIGLAHDPRVLSIHKKAIAELMEKSGLVILEGAPELGGLYTDENLNKYAEYMGYDKDDMRVFGQMLKPGILFYKEIESVARQLKKDIVTMDPIDEDMVSNERRIKLDKNVLMGKLAAFGGSSMLVLDQLGLLRKEKEMKISRRNFLKIATGTAISATAGASLVGSRVANSSPSHSRDSWWEKVLYEELDFRDVVIAKGLDILTKDESIKGPITMIYGIAHLGPVKHYLGHPKEREARFKAYYPYRKIKAPRITHYHLDQQSWNSKETEIGE